MKIVAIVIALLVIMTMGVSAKEKVFYKQSVHGNITVSGKTLQSFGGGNHDYCLAIITAPELIVTYSIRVSDMSKGETPYSSLIFISESFPTTIPHKNIQAALIFMYGKKNDTTPPIKNVMLFAKPQVRIIATDPHLYKVFGASHTFAVVVRNIGIFPIPLKKSEEAFQKFDECVNTYVPKLLPFEPYSNKK